RVQGEVADHREELLAVERQLENGVLSELASQDRGDLPRRDGDRRRRKALAVSDGGHEAALAEAPRLGLACGNAGLGLKNGHVGCGLGAPITCPPVPPVSGSVSIGGYDGAAAFSRPRPLAQSGDRGGAPDARASASS